MQTAANRHIATHPLTRRTKVCACRMRRRAVVSARSIMKGFGQTPIPRRNVSPLCLQLITRRILANRNQPEQAKQMAVKQQKSSKNDARFRAPVAFCWRGVLRSVPYEPRQLFLGSHKRTSQVRVAEGIMPVLVRDDADRAFEPQSSRGTHAIWSTTRFLPGEAHQKG